ncbi:MAG: hypothetical protein NTU73_09180 [Ignavibacteriae bacterium]|nr:hypothetical protein [Ignavibacteriota bacterium]
MTNIKYFLLTGIIFLVFISNTYSQADTNYYNEGQPMSMEDWQKRIDELTIRKNNAYSEYNRLEKEKDTLVKKKKITDSLCNQLQAEVYAMLNTNASEVSEFKNRFDATERKVLDVSAPLSDIKEYWYNYISNSKIRLLSQFRKRYEVMKEKIENWKGE